MLYTKYNLEKIKIAPLHNITLIQREEDVTYKMHSFVRLIYSGYELILNDKKGWANLLYKDSQYIPTVDRFIDTCRSIREWGYLVRRINIPDSYWEFDTARIGRPSDALLYPLITVEEVAGEIIIRGGNHRAAVLHVLGVEKTPVICTTHVMVEGQEKKKVADEIYMEQYNQAIEEFLNGQEWQDYKETGCYVRSFRGEAENGAV